MWHICLLLFFAQLFYHVKHFLINIFFFQTIDCLNNNVTKFCNGQDKYLYIDFEILKETELSRVYFKLLVTAEKVYKCKFCLLKNQYCCTHRQCTITGQADISICLHFYFQMKRVQMHWCMELWELLQESSLSF